MLGGKFLSLAHLWLIYRIFAKIWGSSSWIPNFWICWHSIFLQGSAIAWNCGLRVLELSAGWFSRRGLPLLSASLSIGECLCSDTRRSFLVLGTLSDPTQCNSGALFPTIIDCLLLSPDDKNCLCYGWCSCRQRYQFYSGQVMGIYCACACRSLNQYSSHTRNSSSSSSCNQASCIFDRSFITIQLLGFGDLEPFSFTKGVLTFGGGVV